MVRNAEVSNTEGIKRQASKRQRCDGDVKVRMDVLGERKRKTIMNDPWMINTNYARFDAA